MPFPKDVRSAEDLKEELQGMPLSDFEGVKVMITDFHLSESRKFGQNATIKCADEDGEIHTLYSFSTVVIDQLQTIKQYLPLIVTPMKEGDYYKLY